jgi:hypothetical protein
MLFREGHRKATIVIILHEREREREREREKHVSVVGSTGRNFKFVYN